MKTMHEVHLAIEAKKTALNKDANELTDLYNIGLLTTTEVAAQIEQLHIDFVKEKSNMLLDFYDDHVAKSDNFIFQFDKGIAFKPVGRLVCTNGMEHKITTS